MEATECNTQDSVEENAGRSTEEAIKAITQLLQLLKVKRIICVDDVYALPAGLEEAIGLVNELGPEVSQDVISNDTIPLNAPPEVWRTPFKEWWESLEKTERQLLLQKLVNSKRGRSQKSEINKEDIEAASVLDELFVGLEFLKKSPTEWAKDRKIYFEQAKTRGTLFLFDENLSNDGGSATGGRGLVREVLALKDIPDSICGLLTHNIEPEEEYSIWTRFETPEYDFDPDRAIPVSKHLLLGKPLSFAQRIKRTVLNPQCKKLRVKTSNIIARAQNAAKAKVEAINIYDFEHIVFKASNREGLWEPDTLFRLYGLFQRVEAREKAKTNIRLHNLAANIRSVTEITTEPDSTSADHGAWKIQRLE